MIDIFSLKVEELSAKIKDSQLTSVEICKKYIERINKYEKDVKAWAHFNKKLLMEKAAEADSKIDAFVAVIIMLTITAMVVFWVASQ